MDRGAWGATVHRVAESQTELTKVCIVEAMVFPVLTYRCESLTVKKAEHQRIGAFELQCWKKTLDSPLDSKETKPVNPKGNQP